MNSSSLLYEFKVQIAEYLAGLTNTTIRTLADLIQFDIDHCEREIEILRPGNLHQVG